MPIGKDELKGSEADGSKSQKYCHLCYRKGKFTHPDMSVDQMRETVRRVLHDDKHWPNFLAKFASKQIPKLERWRTP